MSGSARSPARKRVRREERSNSAGRLPFSSSLLIALSAVGAVNNAVTRCLSTTRQKFASSGVPTGLPSYNTVVQPSRSGPYTEKLCPTTQPTSLWIHKQSAILHRTVRERWNKEPGCPENIRWIHAVDVLHRPAQGHCMPAVVSDYALEINGYKSIIYGVIRIN